MTQWRSRQYHWGELPKPPRRFVCPKFNFANTFGLPDCGNILSSYLLPPTKRILHTASTLYFLWSIIHLSPFQLPNPKITSSLPCLQFGLSQPLSFLHNFLPNMFEIPPTPLCKFNSTFLNFFFSALESWPHGRKYLSIPLQLPVHSPLWLAYPNTVAERYQWELKPLWNVHPPHQLHPWTSVPLWLCHISLQLPFSSWNALECYGPEPKTTLSWKLDLLLEYPNCIFLALLGVCRNSRVDSSVSDPHHPVNRYSCHLWGTHLMYAVIIHHMDDVGNSILFFCHMMDDGDFSPL